MQYFKQKNIVCACKRKFSYRRSRSNKCTFCLFLWKKSKIVSNICIIQIKVVPLQPQRLVHPFLSVRKSAVGLNNVKK